MTASLSPRGSPRLMKKPAYLMVMLDIRAQQHDQVGRAQGREIGGSS
jgi:hypothetical protein